MKGITVALYERTISNQDPFGNPVYTEKAVSVDNVLVAPTTADDIVDSQDLEGRKVAYTLAIPKGDAHEWENQFVEFFGERFKVYGIPTQGIEDNIPLAWNKKVTVERVE